jgi:phage terminase large subunit-like protein
VRHGEARSVVEFVETYGRITKDSIAGPTGMPLVLRPWQRHVLGRVFARTPDGKRRHRRAMVGVARKNGKSEFAAALALYGLLAEGDGAEVYSAANDKDQAKLVFTPARRMVEMDPELRDLCKLYRDAIECPATGSVYRALSSESYTKEGLSPTLVIYDELHAAPDRELYDVLSLAMGARPDPLMLIVTTAGVRADRFGKDTIAYTLYQLGRRIASGETRDPTYYMAWWEPRDPNAALDDPRSWAQANPSLGDILDPADMASALPPATPENEYRIKRRNEWVVSSQSWLPHGSWDACAKARAIDPHEPVLLAFDGSWTNDSTGIVGAALADGYLFVVDLWEPAVTGEPMDSQVVEDRIARAMAEMNVRELACDPSLWREQMARWTERGWPVVEFPNILPRMIPAVREFYAAVIEKRLTHDGDPRLARHIANATIKEDSRGQRIVKQNRGQKIDLAVCAVMAWDRARNQPPEPVYFLSA